MRSSRGVAAVGLEVALALLLAGAAGLGIWQLNRPLPGAGFLIVEIVAEGAVVVDARGPLAYRRGHLPDARRLWARDLLAFGDRAGGLKSPEELTTIVSSLGLDPEVPVVVYDDGDASEAALVVLVLRAFGFDARLLAGGIERWQNRGGEITDSPEPKMTTRTEGLEFDRRLLVASDEAQLHLAENEVAPVDVRGREEYVQGHLEGAVNLTTAELLPEGKPPRWSVLNRAFGPARITEDTHPLVYGADATQAAIGWLALAAYGVAHVHVLTDPYPTLVDRGFAISTTDVPSATSTRTSSVCWR